MSEQYSLDQLRDLFKIEGRTKRDALRALNAKIRTMKQQGALMEFKAFVEPSKSNKRVRRFVFLAQQEPLGLDG